VLANRVRKKAIELTPCVHGARVQESAEEAGKNIEDLLDFSVNLNPLGPPKLKKILAKASETVSSYPDNRYPGFRDAAAGYLGVEPENIIPGNGSSELIRLFAETVIEPGDRVEAHAKTVKELSERGARVIVLTHQGRKGDDDFLTLRDIVGNDLQRNLGIGKCAAANFFAEPSGNAATANEPGFWKNDIKKIKAKKFCPKLSCKICDLISAIAHRPKASDHRPDTASRNDIDRDLFFFQDS